MVAELQRPENLGALLWPRSANDHDAVYLQAYAAQWRTWFGVNRPSGCWVTASVKFGRDELKSEWTDERTNGRIEATPISFGEGRWQRCVHCTYQFDSHCPSTPPNSFEINIHHLCHRRGRGSCTESHMPRQNSYRGSLLCMQNKCTGTEYAWIKTLKRDNSEVRLQQAIVKNTTSLGLFPPDTCAPRKPSCEVLCAMMGYNFDGNINGLGCI